MKFSELSQKAPQIADSFSATASELAARSANRARGGFDEQAYLAANPDVAAAVAARKQGSGWEHYVNYGVRENRALDTQGTKDPTARWKYGDRHWTEGVDPTAAQSLYDEIMGITGRLEQYDPKIANQLWRSEGFGSRDKNMQAMVGDLVRKGVTSLADLKVDARPIMEPASYEISSNGTLYRIIDGGETQERVGVSAEERSRLEQDPAYQDAMQQFTEAKSNWRPPIGGRGSDRQFSERAQFTTALPTGKYTGNLINAKTGEIVSAKNRGEPLEEGFGIGHTAAGKGKTNFLLFPVEQKLPDGTTQYNFIPGTQNKATGLRKFMQDFGPVLAMGSMFLGMPGVAAGMGTAGTVAQVGLGALNAANAFDQGNALAGIASLAGIAPGVNQLGNLGLSADTMKTIGTIGQGANLGQAVQNKNWLGALSTGANMAGVTDVAGVPVKQGLHGLAALDAAAKGDYLRAATSGLRAADAKTIPGTEVPVEDAIKGVNLYNAIRRENPLAVLDAATRLGSEPQSAIRRASGGVVPDLSQYMRTLPNGSRTDKLRGIAAIANGA
jgi:hypothetical protein